MADNNRSTLEGRDTKAGGDTKTGKDKAGKGETGMAAEVPRPGSGTSIDSPNALRENVGAIVRGVGEIVFELRRLVQLGELLNPWASAPGTEQESSSVSHHVEDNSSNAKNQIIPSAINADSTAPIQPASIQTPSAALTELQNANFRLREELQLSQKQVDLLDQKLTQTGEELRKALAEATNLRAAVFQGTSKPKVLDEEVAVKFRSLRKQIESIARSQKYGLSVEQNPRADIFKSSRANGPPLTRDDRIKRIQSKIFEILCYHILDRNCFGLDGYKMNGYPGDIESDLGSFECDIAKKVPSSELSDWRIATLACARKLNFASTKPGTVARDIFRVLEPFIVRSSAAGKSATVTTLHNELRTLCQNALELVLTMRRSNGEYICHMLEVNTQFSSNADLAESMSIEGTKSEEGVDVASNDLVAFTICGALIKRPEDMPKKVIVLDKALVVLQAK